MGDRSLSCSAKMKRGGIAANLAKLPELLRKISLILRMTWPVSCRSLLPGFVPLTVVLNGLLVGGAA